MQMPGVQNRKYIALQVSKILLWGIISFFTWICAAGQDKSPSYSTGKDSAHIIHIINSATALQVALPDSAILLLKEAFIESEHAGFPEGVAGSLIHLAIIYMDKGMYAQSLTTFHEAIACCSRYEHLYPQLPFIYNCMGNVYQVQGNYELAAGSYYQAMILCEKLSVASSGGIYDNLGSVMMRLRQYNQAFYYLDKAEKMALEQKNYEVLGFVFADKSTLLKDQKDLDKSLRYSEAALYIGRKYKFPRLQQAVLTNIGSIYIAREMPHKALPFLLETQSLRDSIDIYYRNVATRLLGETYYQLKQYDRAEHYLNKALSEAKKANIHSGQSDIYHMLATVYQTTGRYRQALSAHQTYVQLKDSLLNQTIAENVAQLEIKYRTAEKDREISGKQLLIMQQERHIERKNLWIAGITSGTLILAFILFARYRLYQHKHRLQQEKIRNLQQEQEIGRLRATVEGGEKERNRIARELHDGIMVQFSALKMNLSVLPNLHDSLNRSGEFESIMEQLDAATADLRKTAHRLMPDMLMEKGLVETVHFFCKSLNLGARLNIIFQHYGEIPHYPPDTELSIYRIIQELVQNVIKHADATQAIVQLSYSENLLCITVEDNGKGMSESSHKEQPGMGLTYIRNHVTTLGGHMDISSGQGKGTIVYIEIEMHGQETNYAQQEEHMN